LLNGKFLTQEESPDDAEWVDARESDDHAIKRWQDK